MHKCIVEFVLSLLSFYSMDSFVSYSWCWISRMKVRNWDIGRERCAKSSREREKDEQRIREDFEWWIHGLRPSDWLNERPTAQPSHFVQTLQRGFIKWERIDVPKIPNWVKWKWKEAMNLGENLRIGITSLLTFRDGFSENSKSQNKQQNEDGLTLNSNSCESRSMHSSGVQQPQLHRNCTNWTRHWRWRNYDEVWRRSGNEVKIEGRRMEGAWKKGPKDGKRKGRWGWDTPPHIYIEEGKERGRGTRPFLKMATLLPEEDAQNEM